MRALGGFRLHVLRIGNPRGFRSPRADALHLLAKKLERKLIDLSMRQSGGVEHYYLRERAGLANLDSGVSLTAARLLAANQEVR
jgi:hypothetical protein